MRSAGKYHRRDAISPFGSQVTPDLARSRSGGPGVPSFTAAERRLELPGCVRAERAVLPGRVERMRFTTAVETQGVGAGELPSEARTRQRRRPSA